MQLSFLSPYLSLMRLHQPTGVFLLLWPCWWSIALASEAIPSAWLLSLFAIGAVVMRSAGCVINDIIDRKLDAKVERTKTRPLASGELQLWQGILCLIILLLIGLGMLLQLNTTTIILGVLSLIPVALYPLMKRITYWPQAFLGLTFNWGALMGWAAVTNSLALPAFVLYAGGIFWTLGYDTIYGHQDKKDDALIGIKSTALKLGSHSKWWLSGFYGIALLCFTLSGILMSLHWVFYAMMLAALIHAIWQISGVDLDKPEACMQRFRSNRIFGGIIFAAIVMGNLLA